MMKPSLYPLLFILALNLGSPAGVCSTFSSISTGIVDSQALTLSDNLTFGKWINCRAYQQDVLITHESRQYATYYNSDGYVCVARRTLPDGAWEIITLSDYSIAADDSHNVVSMGIAPGDGTIHLSFDHHVDQLNYRRSIPGIVDSATWDASLFGAVSAQLVSGYNISSVTYPRFDTAPDGDLIFSYRTGYPENGQRQIHRYDATTGLWSFRTQFVSSLGAFSDEYGSSSSRSGYLNPIRYDSNGRIHATWVWREQQTTAIGSQDNHDLMYSYSDDNGLTWHTGDGTEIGGPARIDTPGITGVSIPRGLGLINSNAQTVDDQGRVHVVLRHCTLQSLADAGYEPGEVAYGPTAARRLHHYWRDLNNVWHHTELPTTPGSRSAALVADNEGNLIFVHQRGSGLEVLEATILNNWEDWEITETYNIASGVEVLADVYRWRQQGVLSVPYQANPAQWGDPSAFSVVDFVKAPALPVPAMYEFEIPVSEDAYVRNNGTQDGRGPTVFVKNWTDTFDRKTYLKFNTVKARDPFFSARLRMRINLLTGPVTVAVYEVDDDTWTEDTITWANAPALGNQVAVRTLEPGETFVEWDVTESLASNTDQVQSFALWANAPASEDLTLRAREFEDGSDQPVLLMKSGSPYSEWAEGHHENLDLLMPLVDANYDGISNLLAFSMGLSSPVAVPTYQPVEITSGSSSSTASIRRAQAAALYNPVLEHSASLQLGSWAESPSQQVDVDFYGPGIDRVQIQITQPKQFFRYSVDP
jgi:hypothetical protein